MRCELVKCHLNDFLQHQINLNNVNLLRCLWYSFFQLWRLPEKFVKIDQYFVEVVFSD